MNCRKELLSTLSSSDPEDIQEPVVFTYIKHCPWAEKLRPILEKISNANPKRSFYAYSFGDEEKPFNNSSTSQSCLGFLAFASPVDFQQNKKLKILLKRILAQRNL